MAIKAVIFDLDGVIVSTDDNHYRGWKYIADEEGIPFDREINERLRGVSRMDCLEILLSSSSNAYSDTEKTVLAANKNDYYRDSLKTLNHNDILPGISSVLKELKEKGVPIAIGSSSRNTPLILEQIGLKHFFDAVVDGNDITNSKPDPEVFILAAERLGIRPDECLVVEDADAGVEAALAASMKVLGVGSASHNSRATYSAKDMSEVTAQQMVEM